MKHKTSTGTNRAEEEPANSADPPLLCSSRGEWAAASKTSATKALGSLSCNNAVDALA